MGINQKAAEARERKATAKKSANEKASKAAEDAVWADDDKVLAKKKSRKEEEERKKAEALRKKAETKALLEQEMASIKPTAKQSIQKVTQAQIQSESERRNKVVESIYKPKEVSIFWFWIFFHGIKLVLDHFSQETNITIVTEEPLVENMNRLDPDAIEASGIDEAIKALRWEIFMPK